MVFPQTHFIKYIICREKRVSMILVSSESSKVPPRPLTDSYNLKAVVGLR